jgi:NAD(P)-dependent dehydrogenase (short-subunit alcohol dehydrogenase family)
LKKLKKTFGGKFMLNNKVVLITGGTGGIGSETAKLMAKNNAKVCILYKSNEQAAKALTSISKFKGKIFSYKADICSEQEMKTAVEKMLKEHAHIDVVIHAATSQTNNKPIAKIEWKDFEQHMPVQLKGFYNLVKALLPSIIARSKENVGKNTGKTTNKKEPVTKFIAILTEYVIGKPPAGLSDYITAKYALMGFAKAMSVELAKYNCTVNMISPGMVNTKLIANLPPKLIEMTAEANPLKRIAEPKDVAEAALFLATSASDYLNGANLVVNGGNVMM